MEISINWLAVVVAAIVSMVVGSIWYGPLFGKKYTRAMGMHEWSPEKRAEMKKGMTMKYVWQFIGSLLMFYVLARLISALDQMSMAGGLQVGFWTWLGFVVPLKLSDSLWGGKMTMFWLGIGSMFVTLLVGGAIIGAW